MKKCRVLWFFCFRNAGEVLKTFPGNMRIKNDFFVGRFVFGAAILFLPYFFKISPCFTDFSLRFVPFFPHLFSDRS